MRKCGNISPYMRRSLVIYNFTTAPFWIFSFMRKIWFSFLSVQRIIGLLPFSRADGAGDAVATAWGGRGSCGGRRAHGEALSVRVRGEGSAGGHIVHVPTTLQSHSSQFVSLFAHPLTYYSTEKKLIILELNTDYQTVWKSQLCKSNYCLLYATDRM